MKKTLFALVGLGALVLSGCLPAPGLVRDGPWEGCTVSNDGTTIDCDYAPITWSDGRPNPPRAIEPAPEPPIVVPEPPVIPEDPDPIPNPDPDPLPPTPDPDPEPDPEPEPPAEECKPGWGHGDKNHCHDGPPGLRGRRG